MKYLTTNIVIIQKLMILFFTLDAEVRGKNYSFIKDE